MCEVIFILAPFCIFGIVKTPAPGFDTKKNNNSKMLLEGLHFFRARIERWKKRRGEVPNKTQNNRIYVMSDASDDTEGDE